MQCGKALTPENKNALLSPINSSSTRSIFVFSTMACESGKCQYEGGRPLPERVEKQLNADVTGQMREQRGSGLAQLWKGEGVEQEWLMWTHRLLWGGVVLFEQLNEMSSNGP